MTGFALTPTRSMETLKLTRAEQEIYNLLVKSKPAVASIESLLDALPVSRHERTSYNDGNLIAVHIRNLRRKLPKTQAIETVRGVGYKLVLV